MGGAHPAGGRPTKKEFGLMIANLMMIVAAAGSAVAADARNPVISGYGRIAPAPDAAMQPDPLLRYRVAFSVTKGASDPKSPNPSLDRVARYLNLLGSAGIKPTKGDIVAVVHGPATDLIMNDAAYKSRHGVPNPNLPLINALERAGAEVHVCSQALAGRRIAREQVATSVTIDLSALTTLTTLQLKGWSVIAD